MHRVRNVEGKQGSDLYGGIDQSMAMGCDLWLGVDVVISLFEDVGVLLCAFAGRKKVYPLFAPRGA